MCGFAEVFYPILMKRDVRKFFRMASIYEWLLPDS